MASNSNNKSGAYKKMQNTLKLELSDCTCPICMYILIEPVTMPCGHELCLPCFETNVQETSLLCPMCRLRIASWARRATRNQKLVNQKRWEQIQLAFPKKVKCRLEGREEDYSSSSDEDMFVAPPHLAETGEIRKEYEDEMKKLAEERDRQRREEELASEKLIQDIQAQEFAKQLELERQQLTDETLAKELTTRLNQASSTPSRTVSSSGTLVKTPSAPKTPAILEKFIQKGAADARNRNNNSASKQAGKDPYPYPCYSPTDFGKIISSEMVTKETYPFVDVKTLEENHKMFKVEEKKSSKEEKSSGQNIFDYIFTDSRSQSIAETDKEHQGKNPVLLLEKEKKLAKLPSRKDDKMKKKAKPKTWLKDSDNKFITSVNASIASLSQEKHPTEPVSQMDSEESNSIDTELNHFRPVKPYPRTPPRRLPGGESKDPPIIKSTPRNLKQTLLLKVSEPPENLNPAKLGGSPTMQRRILELQAERQVQVVMHSKGTSTNKEFIQPQLSDSVISVTPSSGKSMTPPRKISSPTKKMVPSSSWSGFISPKPLKKTTTLLELCKKNTSTAASVTAESTMSIDSSLNASSTVCIQDSDDEDDDDIQYLGTSRESPPVIVEETHKEPLLPILPLEHNLCDDDMLSEIMDYTEFGYNAQSLMLKTDLLINKDEETTKTGKSDTNSSLLSRQAQQTTYSSTTGPSDYVVDAFITSENTRSDAANLSFKYGASDATTQSSVISGTTGTEPKMISFCNIITPMKSVEIDDNQDILTILKSSQNDIVENDSVKDASENQPPIGNEQQNTQDSKVSSTVSPGKVYRMKRKSKRSSCNKSNSNPPSVAIKSEHCEGTDVVKLLLTKEVESSEMDDLNIPVISPEVNVQNWLNTHPQILEHSYSKLNKSTQDESDADHESECFSPSQSEPFEKEKLMNELKDLVEEVLHEVKHTKPPDLSSDHIKTQDTLSDLGATHERSRPGSKQLQSHGSGSRCASTPCKKSKSLPSDKSPQLHKTSHLCKQNMITNQQNDTAVSKKQMTFQKDVFSVTPTKNDVSYVRTNSGDFVVSPMTSPAQSPSCLSNCKRRKLKLDDDDVYNKNDQINKKQRKVSPKTNIEMPKLSRIRKKRSPSKNYINTSLSKRKLQTDLIDSGNLCMGSPEKMPKLVPETSRKMYNMRYTAQQRKSSSDLFSDDSGVGKSSPCKKFNDKNSSIKVKKTPIKAEKQNVKNLKTPSNITKHIDHNDPNDNCHLKSQDAAEKRRKACNTKTNSNIISNKMHAAPVVNPNQLPKHERDLKNTFHVNEATNKVVTKPPVFPLFRSRSRSIKEKGSIDLDTIHTQVVTEQKSKGHESEIETSVKTRPKKVKRKKKRTSIQNSEDSGTESIASRTRSRTPVKQSLKKISKTPKKRTSAISDSDSATESIASRTRSQTPVKRDFLNIKNTPRKRKSSIRSEVESENECIPSPKLSQVGRTRSMRKRTSSTKSNDDSPIMSIASRTRGRTPVKRDLQKVKKRVFSIQSEEESDKETAHRSTQSKAKSTKTLKKRRSSIKCDDDSAIESIENHERSLTLVKRNLYKKNTAKNRTSSIQSNRESENESIPSPNKQSQIHQKFSQRKKRTSSVKSDDESVVERIASRTRSRTPVKRDSYRIYSKERTSYIESKEEYRDERIPCPKQSPRLKKSSPKKFSKSPKKTSQKIASSPKKPSPRLNKSSPKKSSKSPKKTPQKVAPCTKSDDDSETESIASHQTSGNKMHKKTITRRNSSAKDKHYDSTRDRVVRSTHNDETGSKKSPKKNQCSVKSPQTKTFAAHIEKQKQTKPKQKSKPSEDLDIKSETESVSGRLRGKRKVAVRHCVTSKDKTNYVKDKDSPISDQDCESRQKRIQKESSREHDSDLESTSSYPSVSYYKSPIKCIKTEPPSKRKRTGDQHSSASNKYKVRLCKTSDIVHDDKENSMDSVDKVAMFVEEPFSYQKTHFVNQKVDSMVEELAGALSCTQKKDSLVRKSIHANKNLSIDTNKVKTKCNLFVDKKSGASSKSNPVKNVTKLKTFLSSSKLGDKKVPTEQRSNNLHIPNKVKNNGCSVKSSTPAAVRQKKTTQTTLTFVNTKSEDEFEQEGNKICKTLTFTKTNQNKCYKTKSGSSGSDDVFSPTPRKKHLPQSNRRTSGKGRHLVVKKKDVKPAQAVKSRSSTSSKVENNNNEEASLDSVRKELCDFKTMEMYRAYIEEQDRLLARKLQADFDMEARFGLNAIRRKGSEDEYKLRRKKRR